MSQSRSTDSLCAKSRTADSDKTDKLPDPPAYDDLTSRLLSARALSGIALDREFFANNFFCIITR